MENNRITFENLSKDDKELLLSHFENVVDNDDFADLNRLLESSPREYERFSKEGRKFLKELRKDLSRDGSYVVALFKGIDTDRDGIADLEVPDRPSMRNYPESGVVSLNDWINEDRTFSPDLYPYPLTQSVFSGSGLPDRETTLLGDPFMDGKFVFADNPGGTNAKYGIPNYLLDTQSLLPVWQFDAMDVGVQRLLDYQGRQAKSRDEIENSLGYRIIDTENSLQMVDSQGRILEETELFEAMAAISRERFLDIFIEPQKTEARALLIENNIQLIAFEPAAGQGGENLWLLFFYDQSGNAREMRIPQSRLNFSMSDVRALAMEGVLENPTPDQVLEALRNPRLL